MVNSYDNLQKFYVDKLKLHGKFSQAAVGWTSPQSQRLRFQAIYDYLKDDRNCSIVDVGCGLGDFFGFLQEQGFTGQYLGIDVVPEMVEVAKQKYPQAQFRLLDLMQENLSADYLVGSGIMSVKISPQQDQWQWIKILTNRMYQLADKATIFNFLSSNYLDEDDIFYPVSSYQIIQYLVTISDIIDVKHNYLYYDFTIYLGKAGKK